MKQLVVTPSFPFSTHTFVTREIAETLARGHDVLILAPTDGDYEGHILANRLKISPQQIIYANAAKMPLLSTDSRRLTMQVREAARREEYGFLLAERRKTFFCRLLRTPDLQDVQLIHAHFAGWAYEVAMPLSRLLGVPYTVTAHDSHLASHSAYHLRQLQNSAAAITLPSQTWRDVWQEKTGHADRLHVLPNAVDTDAFQPPCLPLSGQREIALLTVSRLIPHKRISDGLQAVHRLLNLGIPCRYTVIGDGPEAETLAQVASELGISSHVFFLGAQSHERVALELQRSEIYLHPSEKESFGVAVIEAMAAYLPVVAARSGGTQDTVESGVTGQLYTPGDIDALVDTLTTLAHNPHLRTSWGKAGRARVERLYSWNTHMTALLELWNQALLAGKRD